MRTERGVDDRSNRDKRERKKVKKERKKVCRTRIGRTLSFGPFVCLQLHSVVSSRGVKRRWKDYPDVGR